MAAMMAFLVSAAGTAKKGGGGADSYKGWDTGSSYVSMYKQGQDTIVTGRVVKVMDQEPMPGMAMGAVIVVKDTDNREHLVSLGPKAYLDQESIAFRKGEEVTIKGSSVDVKGKTMIITREVNRAGIGTNTLIDDAGNPTW